LEDLRQMRERAGFTQASLAKASGVDRATINKVEQGKRSPSIETLEKLARAMGAEIGDFFPKAQAPLFPPPPSGGASEQRRVRELLSARDRLRDLTTAARRWATEEHPFGATEADFYERVGAFSVLGRDATETGSTARDLVEAAQPFEARPAWELELLRQIGVESGILADSMKALARRARNELTERPELQDYRSIIEAFVRDLDAFDAQALPKANA
jgi:transcriptional regulator with XRE-family HTH domain